MKVVLFCGGLGTRLKEHAGTIPKPMVDIGYRPLMWHLMKYYAHYGHKEFILCLGYKGDYIKNYFLNYNECLSNDFVMSKGGADIRLYNSDIGDWTITFVDTGLESNVGQRLKAVQPYLDGDEVFLANYTDGLSDLPLPTYLEAFERSQKVGGFVTVRPSVTFHVVQTGPDGAVRAIEPAQRSDLWINAGFFVFTRGIFDYMRDGEELVMEPFARLIGENQLMAYRHEGFFTGMDTFKEKQLFDDLYSSGRMPWAVWKNDSPGLHHAAAPGLPAPRSSVSRAGDGPVARRSAPRARGGAG
jgi:glucose-1-phosphate cytidylyltransferase